MNMRIRPCSGVWAIITPVALLAVALLVGVAHTEWAVAQPRGEHPHTEGRRALARGDVENAVKFFTEAIEEQPGKHFFYNDRGVAYKRAGKPEKAISDYNKALEIKPDYTQAWNNRGVIYLGAKDYARAIDDFTEGLKHGGLETKLYTNRGLAYLRLKRYDDAVADLRKAVSLSPLDRRSIRFLAEALAESGEIEKAKRMYRLALDSAQSPRVADLIRKQIRLLESKQTAPRIVRRSPPPEARPTQEPPPAPADSPPIKPEEPEAPPKPAPKKAETRDKAPARPEDEVRPKRALTWGKTDSQADRAETEKDSSRGRPLDRLYRKTFNQVFRSFSPGTAGIFNRGRLFFRNGDYNKALVRLEDTVQLAERRNNKLGSAWALMEIGRTYGRMGQPLRAASYLEDALRTFRREGAHEEALITMAALVEVNTAAGRQKRAAEFKAIAISSAVAAGRNDVAEAVRRGDFAISSTSERVHGRKDPKRGERTADKIAKDTKSLGGVGSLPARWEDQGPQIPSGRRAKALALRNARIFAPKPSKKPVAKSETPSPPPSERGISRTSAEKQIERALDELRKFKEADETAAMIPVLERLADLYLKSGRKDKALYALSAVQGYRRETGADKGTAELYLKTGRLRAECGSRAGALEDFARAAVFAKSQGKSALEKKSQAAAKELSKKLGLPETGVLEALEKLWSARESGNGDAEPQILHEIGRMYENVGRLAEALGYFDRASAAILAEKARVYQRLGRPDQARASYDEALKALKELDYSRYLQMKKRSKLANTVSSRR